ncbi:McrC family protein [Burkholderia glumae]|uniref:McrC family protein n=1 Tax=Burkholderia glumae TaxID=337 RepID=UPI002151DC6A|nr:McrC family protein [Burkholderia glumae]
MIDRAHSFGPTVNVWRIERLQLIDGSKANNAEKYGLSQADFYQLHAYGQAYLDGQGDVV